MKPLFFRTRNRSAQAAFTLTEMVVAVGILLVGMGIALPFLSGDMGLYVRNFSINKSNNSLRSSLENLKRDLNMSIEPPYLATCAISGGTATVTPLANATVSANAILAWVNLGPNYQMLPDASTASTTKTIVPANGITIVRHTPYGMTVNTQLEDGLPPLPQVGDRILIMSPGPYTNGMPETVGAIQKPGRRITAVTTTGGAAVTTANAKDPQFTTFIIKIDETNTALPTNSASKCTVPGNNSVTFFREVVYAVNTVNDASGQPAERQLLYYPTTAKLTGPRILIRDLDPTPQEIDPRLGSSTVIQPFNYYAGRGNVSALSVNLPIRAVDYARAVGDRNLGAATADVSATEFNLYLRSSTAMSIKARIDDNALTQITAK